MIQPLWVDELVTQACERQLPLRLQVTSGSMAPAIQAGDWLVVESQLLATLHMGDVVVLRRQDGFVAHRFVMQRRGQIITRGDALPGCDAPHDARALVGRVVAIERGSRRTDLLSWQAHLIGWWIGESGLWRVRLSSHLGWPRPGRSQ